MHQDMCILYGLKNGVYHSPRISNLHNDFKKQVLINNCSMLFICKVIVLFSSI